MGRCWRTMAGWRAPRRRAGSPRRWPMSRPRPRSASRRVCAPGRSDYWLGLLLARTQRKCSGAEVSINDFRMGALQLDSSNPHQSCTKALLQLTPTHPLVACKRLRSKQTHRTALTATHSPRTSVHIGPAHLHHDHAGRRLPRTARLVHRQQRETLVRARAQIGARQRRQPKHPRREPPARLKRPQLDAARPR